MSTLRIEHHTTYRYGRPIEFGRHRLVLRPREGHDLHVVRMALDIVPRHRLLWSRDVFGNSIALVDFTEDSDRLEFRSEVIVHRTVPFEAEEPHLRQRVPFPVEYESLERVVVGAYQAVSFPDDAMALYKWLGEALPERDPADAESVVVALNLLIHRQITYNRRSERGVQSPAQTLALGSGSCRDLAVLLMDGARALGFATRFVSGYLDCPASIAGRASTHAWAEVYLPHLGWRGYDPTIGESTSLKHVTTGVSNHPRGVMPISGHFNGTSADYQGMTVTVKTESLPREAMH